MLAKATLSRQAGKLKQRQDALLQGWLPTARNKFTIEGNCRKFDAADFTATQTVCQLPRPPTSLVPISLNEKRPIRKRY